MKKRNNKVSRSCSFTVMTNGHINFTCAAEVTDLDTAEHYLYELLYHVNLLRPTKLAAQRYKAAKRSKQSKPSKKGKKKPIRNSRLQDLKPISYESGWGD